MTPLAWAAVWTVVALVPRLVGLADKSLWFDEALSVEDSRTFGVTFGSGFHPPLYYVLLHGWMALFGDSPVALRLSAAIPGALSVGLTYLLGRRLFEHRAGCAAAALLAVASLHVEYSQEVRMYAVATLFVTGAALALAHVVADPGRHRRTWLLFGCFSLLSAAALLAHYLAALAVGGMVLALVVAPQTRTVALRVSALLVLAALAGLALYGALGYSRPAAAAIRFLTTFQEGNQTIFQEPIAQAIALPFNLCFQLLPGLFLKWIILSPLRLVAVLVVDAAVVLAAVAVLRDRETNASRRVLALVPPLFAFTVTYFAVGASQLRFYLFSSAFVAVAVGAGLVRGRPAILHRIALGLTLALSLLATWWYLDFPTDKQPWRAVGARIAREERPGDVVLVTEPHFTIALDRYFAPRQGAEIVPFPEDSEPITSETQLRVLLAPLVRDRSRVWYVRMAQGATRTDPNGLALEWLRANFRQLSAVREPGYNGSVEVYLFER